MSSQRRDTRGRILAAFDLIAEESVLGTDNGLTVEEKTKLIFLNMQIANFGMHLPDTDFDDDKSN